MNADVVNVVADLVTLKAAADRLAAEEGCPAISNPVLAVFEEKFAEAASSIPDLNDRFLTALALRDRLSRELVEEFQHQIRSEQLAAQDRALKRHIPLSERRTGLVSVRRVQRPVGQGGFHTCSVRVGDSRYEYVYDCGSVQRRALLREVDAYSEEVGPGRTLDLLALSHLDEDHVNGVEWLLARHKVEAVLLPYLHPWDRLLLVAEACGNGRLTESYFTLLQNAGRWFSERGAQRVIFVLGPQDDGPNPVRVPEAPRPSDWRNDSRPVDLKGAERPTPRDCADNPGLSSDAEVVRAGHSLDLAVGHIVAWQIVPYMQPEPSRIRAFAKRVSSLLGVPVLSRPYAPTFFARLKRALEDRSRRVQLGLAYEEVRKDRNLASMSLYSGPAWRWSDGSIRRLRYGNREVLWRDDRVAWIGTGDSVLTVGQRAEAFARCFANVFPFVGSLVVPHHGSRHNFAGSLFREILRPDSWVIPYGKNSYSHPWPPLVAALSRRGTVVGVRERSVAAFEEDLEVE